MRVIWTSIASIWMLVCMDVPVLAASCISPPVSTAEINAFRANPSGLISGPSIDARAVEVSARNLAGTDSSLAKELVKLAQNAPAELKSAIAAGLAQAAIACSTVDAAAAQEIQLAVASYQDAQFQALFAAVSGDFTTAAVEAAAGAAAASAGSVVIVNPAAGGTGSPLVPGGARKSATTPDFPVAGLSVLGGTSGRSGTPFGSGTTSANPVSATR